MDDKIHILKHQTRPKPNIQLCSDKQLTKQIEKLQLPKTTEILKKYGLSLLLCLLSFTCFSQVPEVWPEEPKTLYLEMLDSSCTRLYDFNDSIVPEDYILNEEWTAVGTDTFEGFWVNQMFFVPSRGIYLEFLDCGVRFDYVPQQLTEMTQPVVSPMPKYHWSMAGQAASLPIIWIGSYYGGLAEGELTNTTAARTVQGLHPRNQQSHSYRNQATIATGIGLLTLGISCYEYERQLRRHAPRKGHTQGTDFWFSTEFWPTLGRNALFITGAVVGGHISAQIGYNAKVNNP